MSEDNINEIEYIKVETSASAKMKLIAIDVCRDAMDRCPQGNTNKDNIEKLEGRIEEMEIKAESKLTEILKAVRGKNAIWETRIWNLMKAVGLALLVWRLK